MKSRLRSVGLALGLTLALGAIPAAGVDAGPTLHFSVFAQTDLPLGQAYWTGREWLWNAENDGKIEAADANGRNVRTFFAFDQGGEELRCAVPPNKLWPDGVYCHTPDNRVLRLNRDGTNPLELARIPADANSDGALAFDDVGKFGYALLVATGGSGQNGGQVFAVRKNGRVQPIGSYPGPGGADEIAIAPAKFGSASGWCLITVDNDPNGGTLLAIDRKGTLRTIAPSLGNSLNPIAVVKPAPKARAAGGPAPGLYLADTVSKAIWFAPASAFESFVGTVVVGTEVDSKLWVIRPNSSGGFDALPAASDLPSQGWNFEASAYVP
jgi:hypothetical protein